MTRGMERHQVLLYLLALAVGGAVGVLFPDVAGPAAVAINPILALLLYVTFLGVPFRAVGAAGRDLRFLGAVLVLNFLFAPVVAWLLSRVVSHDQGLLLGVLLVLLAPCVDYVVVFAGLAGGAKERLLAATPLLMVTQMLLIPVFLWWFTGAEVRVDPAPFWQAFAVLILLPLIAAVLTQLIAPRWVIALQPTMVPLMMMTLAVVVASQISPALTQISALLLVVPLFVVFAVVMLFGGIGLSALAHLDAPRGRALVFSGVTRNSLVILPLALATSFDLAPLVVVTQTLVELVVLTILVRLVPRLVGLAA